MKYRTFILFIIFFASFCIASEETLQNEKTENKQEVTPVLHDTPFSINQLDIDESTVPTTEMITSKIGVGLFITLGIILGLSWFVKKIGLNNISQIKGMNVLNRLSLGGKEQVMLIDVEGERILLGVSPGRVNYLKTLKSQPLQDSLTISNDSYYDNNVNYYHFYYCNIVQIVIATYMQIGLFY